MDFIGMRKKCMYPGLGTFQCMLSAGSCCRQLLHAQANGRAVMKLWLMAHFLRSKFSPTRLCPLLPPPHTDTHFSPVWSTSSKGWLGVAKVTLRDYIVNDQFHLKSSSTVSLCILVAGCSFNMTPL